MPPAQAGGTACERRARTWSGSFDLGFEGAATGVEVLVVDAETYGGAIGHANVQEHPRLPTCPVSEVRNRTGHNHSAH